jgi:hypothetical protein
VLKSHSENNSFLLFLDKILKTNIIIGRTNL